MPRRHALRDAEACRADGIPGRHVREPDELAARRRLLRAARPGQDLLDLLGPADVPVALRVGLDREAPGLLEQERAAREEDAHPDERGEQHREVGQVRRVGGVGIRSSGGRGQAVGCRGEAPLEGDPAPVDAGGRCGRRAVGCCRCCLPALDRRRERLGIAGRGSRRARVPDRVAEARDALPGRRPVGAQSAGVAGIARELPRQPVVHLLLDRAEQRRRRRLGVVAGSCPV